MEFLIACDLEGIHGVVGEPYQTLTDSFDYSLAVEGAVCEINTAAKALFDQGATKVLVWDNHGKNLNIDFSLLDPRVIRADAKKYPVRGDFAKEHQLKGVVFLGYHAKEGAPNGVLAHTYSSKSIQYVKLNGESIGELYIDSRIWAAMGIKSIFHAGCHISVAEMNAVCPEAVTVVTKYGEGRNRAVLRGREEVLNDIYKGVTEAVRRLDEPITCTFPASAQLEVRYTRAERTEEVMRKAQQNGIPAAYGEDTHILRFEVSRPNQITMLL